jgi:hypothetical protein
MRMAKGKARRPKKPKKVQSNHRYSTSDELEFISGLGTGIHRETKSGCVPVKLSRLEMLKRYRRACDHRRWDKGIDSEAIIDHVERWIRIIEKKGEAWNYI